MILIIEDTNVGKILLEELKTAAIGIIDGREVVKDRLCHIEIRGDGFFVPLPNAGSDAPGASESKMKK